MKNILTKTIDVFLVTSFLALTAAVCWFLYSFNTQDKLNLKALEEKKDSYVYDNKKELIGIISTKTTNQESLKYEDLNQSVINSLVGTEDSKFFEHLGVDFLSTLDKTVKSIVKKDNSAGGSTITQQLIGDVYLDRNEKTYDRKFKEILYSLQYEKRVSKKEILTNYLNHFFYGKNNIYGIKNASKYFFNKSAAQLDYVQAAMLNGSLNAPSVYNPLGGSENNYSQQRLNNVLSTNHNKGYLSDAEHALLNQVKVENEVNFNKTDLKKNPYGAYLDMVRKELEDNYQVDFDRQSLKIYTAMDKSLQNYANDIAKQKVDGAKLPDNDMDYGFIIENNENGEIQAIGGGKSYKDNPQNIFNNGYDLKKQPGSAIKPIIDYMPAIEFAGFNQNTLISNQPHKYRGTDKSIRNPGNRYWNKVNIIQALATSSNVAAVRTLEQVVDKIGFDGLHEYLTKMGFKFDKDELVYSYALGGLDKGVSPLEMAQAYSVIANGGKFIPAHTIKYFTIDDKDMVESKFKPEQVVSKKTANLMNELLHKSRQQSNLFYAVKSSKNYAAKSGTSDWGSDGKQYGIPQTAQKDSWTVGFYENTTIAVWTGFDEAGIKKGKYPQWGAQHDYSANLFGKLLNKS